MPWKIADVDKFAKGLSDKQKAAWINIANSTLDLCLHNGGNQANCEGKAVRIANAKAQEIKEAIMPKESKFVIITEAVLSESKVDRENKIIHNVVLLTKNSLNTAGKVHRTYTDDCLDRAAVIFEGAPAFIDHPGSQAAKSGRSVREQYGFYRGVKRIGEKLVADDLVLYDVPDAALVMSIAEKNPLSAGNSIHAAGRVKMSGGIEIVEELLPRTKWGYRSSVDLVDDPATTRGIFESKQKGEVGDMEWAELTVKDLQDNRKDIIESIKTEGAVEGKASRDKEVTDISEKLKAAEILVDGYKAKEVLAEKTATMEKLLKESKLPVEAQTETFKGVLMAVQEKKDGEKVISVEDGMKALIEDRETFLKPAGGVKNMGNGKTILENKDGKVVFNGKELSNKDIAESLKRQ